MIRLPRRDGASSRRPWSAPRRHPLVRRWPPVGRGHVHIVVFHGGAENSAHRSWPLAFAPLRALWFASALAVRFVPQHAVVHLVLHRVAGWNETDGAEPDPVLDGRSVLDSIAHDDPDAALVLVGHSMGARTAIRLLDSSPRIRGAVLLAPWLPADEPAAGRADQVTVAVQGGLDTISRPRDTRAFVEEQRSLHRRAGYVEIAGAGHGFIARVRRTHGLLAAAVAEVTGLHARRTLPAGTFVGRLGRR